MSTIVSPVGPGQANLVTDVVVVQKLLNDNIVKLIPFIPLRVDGRFGLKTETLIR